MVLQPLFLDLCKRVERSPHLQKQRRRPLKGPSRAQIPRHQPEDESSREFARGQIQRPQLRAILLSPAAARGRGAIYPS